ncbi:MAG TPA: GTP cyclohydrolase I, partial [Aggregatilineales bacterium]|nr:GTP cyclohydrolase I [Aggregatilineales bacterium]
MVKYDVTFTKGSYNRFIKDFYGKSGGLMKLNGNGHANGNGKTPTHPNGNGNGKHNLIDMMQEKFGSDDFLQSFELGFPPVERDNIEDAVEKILYAVGEDPKREGLQRTPHRVAKAYEELLEGYRIDPAELINGAIFDVEYDDMVIVRDIEYYSLCEHHMLPFIGRAHVAYIPNEKVIGLSKIPRIVDMFARRLQVQERLTRQIADFV